LSFFWVIALVIRKGLGTVKRPKDIQARFFPVPESNARPMNRYTPILYFNYFWGITAMIRLSLILCATLYVGMILLTDGPGAETARAPSIDFNNVVNLADDAVGVATTRAGFSPSDGLISLSEDVPISVIIPPARYAPALLIVASFDAPTDANFVRAPVVSASEGAALLYVTGTSVNLRSGPSTSNPVITALTRGIAAEKIEILANGWVQIRVLETGNVGYMSSRFLSSNQP
jgi:hypothetical protein